MEAFKKMFTKYVWGANPTCEGPSDENILSAIPNHFSCTEVELKSVVETLRKNGFHVCEERVIQVWNKKTGSTVHHPDENASSHGKPLLDFESRSEEIQGLSSPSEPACKRARFQQNIDVEASVEKISSLLRDVQSDQEMDGKRHLVVVGVTGSGKSTLINSLAGCKLRMLTPEEADQQCLCRDSLCVVSVKEGGPRDSVTEIGFRYGESKTTEYRPVNLHEMGLVIWDVPGFEDTNGREVNIANAVKLSKLLKGSQKQGLVVMVVLDAPSLESGRGQLIKKTVDLIVQLFRSDESEKDKFSFLKQNIHGILFCVTKAKKGAYSLKSVKSWIQTAASNAGLDLTASEEMIMMYDPLHKNSEAISREKLISQVLSMTTISRKEIGLFSPCLSDGDLRLIQEIKVVSVNEIRSAMGTSAHHTLGHSIWCPDFDKVRKYFELFQNLNIISNNIWGDEVDELLRCITDAIQTWKSEILQRRSAFDENNRRIIKNILTCIEGAFVLDDIIQEVLSVGNISRDLKEMLREDENVDQTRRRDTFRKRFVDIGVKDAVKEHCKTLEPTGRCLGVPTNSATAFQLFSQVRGMRNLEMLIGEIKAFGITECEKIYVSGDQIAFEHVALQLEEDFMQFTRELILETNFNILRSKLNVMADGLISEYEWPPRNGKFKSLCDCPFDTEDVMSLLDFGFDQEFVNQLHFTLNAIKSLQNVELQERIQKDYRIVCEHVIEKAVKQLKQVKEVVRESARKRLNRILAVGEFQKDKADLKEALHDLKQLDGETDPVYLSAVEDVKTRIAASQTEGEIQTLIQARSYHELISRYQTLQDLCQGLKAYLKIDTRGIEAAVMKEISTLIERTKIEIMMDVDSKRYLESDELRTLANIYTTLVTAFPNIRTEYEQLQSSAKRTLQDMISKAHSIVLSCRTDSMRREEQDNIAKLLVKSCAVATELGLIEHFQTEIRLNLLKGLKDHDRYMIGTSLRSMSTCADVPESVHEIARIIIATYPEFKNFNIELFNSKAGGVSFDKALDQLRCCPEGQKTNRKEKLMDAYNAYTSVYSEQINCIVKDISEFPVEANKSRIDALAQILSPQATRLGSMLIEFGELLALICAQWTYLSAKSGTQEGLEKKNVRQPHSTQILGIFRLLGLDNTVLQNHLIQINTGEGKSIALGFLAAVLAKLGYRVDVVCYNRYLSERDYQSFSELFESLGVDQRVGYFDFDQLSSRILKEGVQLPNVRASFLSFLEGNSNDPGTHVRKIARRSQRKEGASRGSSASEGHAYRTDTHSEAESKVGEKRSQPESEEPDESKRQAGRILLLDEVDVFFSDDFYGRPHRPAQEFGGGVGFFILKYVWENRNQIGDSEIFIQKLLGLSHTNNLREMYPNLSVAMLTQEFQKMIICVKRFAGNGLPRLKGGEKNYVIDSKLQAIAYNDPVSGVPSYSTSYSYVTAFTYLYCCQEGKLSEERVKDKLKIQAVCGSLLYSEIPQFYQFTLGMTGTLDCLTEAQNKMLDDYKFTHRTYLPSTFSKQQLNAEQFKRNPESVLTAVVRGSYDEYFSAILQEITQEMSLGRAILVVFEDYSKLLQFSNEIKIRSPKLPKYCPPLILTDSLSDAERQSVITRAVRRYAITLMTRPYGRGTDFVCCDEGLRKNGGVHVIITFFPEDESENKQINGRTCRQDDPGSARKILFEDDLAYLGATEQQYMVSGFKDWDEYLAHCRNALHDKKYQEMHARHAELMVKHTKTLEACMAVRSADWNTAETNFLELNRELPQKIASGGSVDICFAMDCTGSMGSWINACKDRVMQIASQTKALICDHAQSAKVRMSFVAYRDYTSTARSGNLSYDMPGIEVCPFTENIQELQTFVSRMQASGGGDTPEDMCGGLRHVQSLCWEATAKHLFLIADAPCHGSRYHTMPDNFSGGDPTGLVPEEQLADLMREGGKGATGIKVTFVSINPSTERMIGIFNQHCTTAVGRGITVVDLSHCSANSQSITAEFGKAIEEEITSDWIAHHC